MRRLLDAFSKRDKSSRIEPSQSSPPAFRVPLRGGPTTSQFSTPLPSPISSEPSTSTKPRSLGAWLNSRRGRKQTSLLVSSPDPSTKPQKSDQPERSLSHSQLKGKDFLKNKSLENLLPERKPSKTRLSLLRSHSAHVSSRSNTQDVPPTPTLSESVLRSSRAFPDVHRSSLNEFFSFTERSLADLSDPPPLIPPRPQDSLAFPTSIAPHSRYISRPSLYVKVHKGNLLKYRNSDNLPGYFQSELRSISNRRWEARKARQSYTEAFPHEDPDTVLLQIPLQHWMARPCFEERFSNYVSPDGVTVHLAPVSNGVFAVADLEFSEHLENLASVGTQQSPPIENVTPIIRQTLQDTELISPQRSDSTDSGDAEVSPRALPQPKRGVRFQAQVEEVEPDDLVPLAVVQQAKKRKEERRRTLLLQEEKRIQKALVEARRAEKAAKEEEARRKVYAAEFVATRERRESQRIGYQPGKRASMISSSSSLSISSIEGAAVKRPIYDPRRASSGSQGDDKHLRPVPRSRPASYTSSGEESPNPFGDRASSAGSGSALGHSSRSVTSSTESLTNVRTHSRERSVASNHTSRSRKSSSAARHPTQQEPVPPVPFLARSWNVPDLPLPPPNLMQQGPFLASIRTQGAYMPPPMPNFYLNAGGPMMMVAQPSTTPPGNVRPKHPQHHNSFPRSSSGSSSTPKPPSDRRSSSYGPRTQNQTSRS